MISLWFILGIIAAKYTTAIPYRTSRAAAEEHNLLDGIASTGPYSLTIEDGDYSDLFAPQLSIHNREISQLDYGEVSPGPVRIDRTSEKQRSPELASYTTKVPYIYEDVRSTFQAAAEKQKVLDNISPQSSSNAGGDSLNISPQSSSNAGGDSLNISPQSSSNAGGDSLNISPQSSSNAGGDSLNLDDGEYSDLLPILKQQNDIEDLQLGYGEVIESPARSETTIDKQGVEDLVYSQEPLPTIAAETQTPAIVTTIATEPVSTITAEPVTLPKVETIVTVPINTSDIEATALPAMSQLPLEPQPTIAIETIAPTVVPSLAPVPTNISNMETPVSPIVPSYAPVSSVTSSPGLTDLPKEPTVASAECGSVVSPCVPYNGGVCQAIACIPVETRTYDIFCLEANCFCCMTSLRVSEALPSPAFTPSTSASSIVNVSEALPSPAFTTSTAATSIVNDNITTRVPNAINATGSVPITNSGSGTINGSSTTTSPGTLTTGGPDNETITDQGLTTTNAPAHINATSPGSLQTTGSGAITTIGPGPAVITTSTPVTPCPNELQGIIKILICMNMKFEENTKCSACPSSLLKPLH